MDTAEGWTAIPSAVRCSACGQARRTGGTPVLLSKLYENSFELLRVRVQRAIGPDNEIGAGNFLFNRPLRGQALLDLIWRPTAREQSFALGGGGTGDANDFVEMGFGPGFEQQWNHNDGERAVFLAPDFNLGEPAFADARMEDGFKFFARGGIGKNDFRQFIATKPAVRGDDFFAEFSLNFGEGGLAGLNELPREFVGVHHLRAAGAEESGSGGFAHAHAAGQTADFHWPRRVTARGCSRDRTDTDSSEQSRL